MLYAKYDALDVAEYVLNYCENELNKPINNLKLQKILYYIQGMHLRIKNKPLFHNIIEAGEYGAIIPDIYYCYYRFVTNPITGIIPKENNIFNNDEMKIMRAVVDETIDRDIWELVHKICSETPWKNNFVKGYSNEILMSDMEDYFNKK